MIEITKITECLNYVQDIDLVIFDLDDTLTNEIDYVKSGFDAIAKAFPEIKDCSKKLLEAFKQKKKPIDEVLKSEGIDTEENVNRALGAYRNHKPNIKFISGAEDVLITLRKQGKKLGVITDGRVEGQQAKIDALQLEKYVDRVIITDSLGGVEYRKPNTKAYEIMQKYFNVPFSRMIYIGDNINKDFDAPQKLGMQSIYFRNSHGLYR